MRTVALFLPAGETRFWHKVLLDRLVDAKVSVSVNYVSAGQESVRSIDAISSFESALYQSADQCLLERIDELRGDKSRDACDVRINLSSTEIRASCGKTEMTVLFDGARSLKSAASTLCKGKIPTIDVCLDGIPVYHAEPMVRSRVLLVNGLEDFVARVITSILVVIRDLDHFKNRNGVMQIETNGTSRTTNIELSWNYLVRTIPRQVKRSIQHVTSHDHWYVGFRLNEGPGVHDTLSTAGSPWSILNNDKYRFLADPFPFAQNGNYFVFVEELRHGEKNGFISVCEMETESTFSEPRQVLVDNCHLSYPHVFQHDGEIWMIPESGNGRRTCLFRAKRFPDVWELERVLIEEKELFDASILQSGDKFWIFAAERDGFGTASDTLVVFYADEITGPWLPHPANPLAIDKAAARPGGAISMRNGKMLLPLQNGSRYYGGGLGLAEIVLLDAEQVGLSRPKPIKVAENWPCDGLHTLNRSGQLETIDGFTRISKLRGS